VSQNSHSILFLGGESGEAGTVRDALRELAEQFELSVVPDIADALHAIESGQFDIVFLDVSGMNGGLREVITRIKSRGCESPSVIALAVRDRPEGDSLLLSGACDYLLAGRGDPASLLGAVRSVIERRKLTKALAFSNERYSRLLGSVTDYTYSVVIRDNRPVTSSHSPGCAAVTGYTVDEYHADPHLWFRMIHHSDRQAVLHMVSQVLCGGNPAPLEHRIIHKTGDIRWIRNTPMPRYDQQGILIAYDGLVTDITARKRAEEALLESETRYRTLVDTTPDTIFLVDRDLRFLFVNNAGSRMIGKQSDELTGKKHGDVFPPDVARKQEVLIQRVFSTGAPLETDIRHCVGSREVWNFARLVPMFDDGGSVSTVLGVVMDITDRKLAEEALRQSEQLLQREFLNVQRAKQEWEITFDTISDPIFIHDKNCRIIRANKAYQEVAGIPFQDIIGKPFPEIFPNIDNTVDVEGGDVIRLDARQPNYYVEELAMPSLSRVFRGKTYPIYDDAGELLHCVQVLEDITETKRAEDAMKQEMEISANLLMLAEAATDSLDPGKLMEWMTVYCRKVLNAGFLLSYLWDGATNSYRPERQQGLSSVVTPLFKTEPLDPRRDGVAPLVAAKRPVVLAALAEQPDAGRSRRFTVVPVETGATAAAETVVEAPFDWMSRHAMCIVIPLVGKAAPLGLLVAGFDDHRILSDRDRKLIGGIARQASLALDEASLYHTAMERSMALAHKVEILKVIHEIDMNILSSLEPKEVVETALQNITKVIPCDRAEAMILDVEQHLLVRYPGSGGSETGGRILSISDTSASEVLASCRTRYDPDIGADDGLRKEEAGLLMDGFRSLLRTPLIVKGSAAGFVSLASRRRAAFTFEDLGSLEQLAGLIGIAFENIRLVTDMQELFFGTVKSLSSAIDAKSSWTAGHSERVTRYALMLGQETGMNGPELRSLEMAALLHDVGKLGTYDMILDKECSLTADEYEIIKRHPVRGAELLKPIKQMRHILPAVLHHHERYDGSGYPDGLKGSDIPGLARVLAVADAFDSMTAWRPYRRTFTCQEAIAELRRCAGTQFDPVLVEAFIASLQKLDQDPARAA